MKIIRKIFSFCLFTIICVTSYGQKPRLYTPENGLSNSKINCISQDRDGFIWICTEDGLVRFDGMDFSTWHFDGKKSNSLASNLVTTVFQDSRNNFWVGTSKGLQLMDAAGTSLRTIDLQDPSTPESAQHISCICENGGELWISGSEHGIHVMDIASGRINTEKRAALNAILPSLFNSNLFLDSKGRMWVASETGGLVVIDPSGVRRLDTEMWDARSSALAGNLMVSCFAEDGRSGNIIIGTLNQGIVVFENDRSALRQSADPSARNCSVQSLLYNQTLTRAEERTILVGSENKGLKLYDPEKDRITDADINDLPADFTHWKIHSMIEDNQQNIWLGAYQKGVLVIPHSMYGFYTEGAGMGCVTSILKDNSDRAVWTGTDGNGLIRYAADGSMTVWNSGNSGLSDDSVMALAKDKRGTIWIGTYQQGLFTMKGNKISRYGGQADLASEKTVTFAYDAEKDLLYVGTYGGGLNIISAADMSLVGNITGNVNKWINSLYIDSSGMLWIGTFNGIYCYNENVGRILTYGIGAAQERVYCFCEGRDGTMWAGTGEGLVAFRRSGDVEKIFTEADGLAGNVVCAVLEADDGNIWASTTSGLSRLNPASGDIVNFYSFDGLQGNEFNYRSALKDEKGMLMFGGMDGLTYFYPEMSDRKQYGMPPVYISHLDVMNERTEAEGNRLTLPYKSKMFSISFAVLEYTNPLKTAYLYKMENFDTDWHRTGPQARTATYTNLPPGKYRFVVRAFFDGNETDFSSCSMDIRILHPWYSSLPAYFVYALLLAALGLVIARSVKKYEQNKENRRKANIQEIKLETFTNISHEIRTPLTLVQAPLKQLREKETDPQRKDLYNLMYRNCLRINRMVNQIMDMQKMDGGKMEFHFRETDIVFFIKDIMKSFENMAASNRIITDLSSVNEVENIWIDQGNFDKVIYNILSNAFKFTPEGGEVKVDISAPEPNGGRLPSDISSLVTINISNSGSRIDASDPDKVFERYYQGDVMDARVGTGVGLHLAKMIVERHHGAVSARNTEDGVLFSVLLPVGNAHLSEEEMSTTTHHKDLYNKTVFGEALVDNHEDQTYVPENDSPDKSVKSKYSLVIVDDDREFCDYLRMELRAQYNIHTCTDGKEAWAYISTAVPDAVITDLVMEGMNGLELCKKIKHNPMTNHVPVIMLTSHTGDLTAQISTENGADLFLTKPVGMDLLKGSVANLISTRETLKNKFATEINYDYDEIRMTSSGSKIIAAVIDSIKANIDNPDFSVEDLSREVGLSRVHLNRKLKEGINISPSYLIKSMRLKQAAYLLINNEVNISEVAYRVGFSTPSYFSSSFGEFFGIAPKEFVARYHGCTDEEVLKNIFK